MEEFYKHLTEKRIQKLLKQGKTEAAEYMRLNQDKIQYNLMSGHLLWFWGWKIKTYFVNLEKDIKESRKENK